MGVIINAGGGGGGGNVRYNPDNDMVEIKYNGTWTPWKSGNMQLHYLYRDGERIVEFISSGNWTFTDVDVSGYTTSGAWTSSGIYTKIPVDVTNYSWLRAIVSSPKFNGQMNVNILNATGTFYACLYSWNNGSGNASSIALQLDTQASGIRRDVTYYQHQSAGNPGAVVRCSKIWLE